jgi:hypothetical protein
MYKCVDARGVTHYTENPLPGCKGGAVDIKPLPPPSGKESTPATDVGEQEREFRRRQMERGKTEQKEAMEREAAERRCLARRSDLERMTNSRLYARDAKGERAFLDDADRAKHIARAQEEVAKACR